MRPASSVREVLSDPIGAYFAGRSFVVWFHPRLAGAMVFGRLDPADAEPLRQLMASPVLGRDYSLLCDLGALEEFTHLEFEIVTWFVRAHAPLLSRLCGFAGVRPGGVAGASLAGVFYEHVKPSVRAAMFADRREALAWLGYRHESREAKDTERVVATIQGMSALRRRLRDYLIAHVTNANVDDAARALGTSGRSLQRELAAEGTTFRAELIRARVRLAESLLSAGETKIEAIARLVGFRSMSAFSAMFGRLVGETPRDFRQRRRGSGTTRTTCSDAGHK